MATILQTQAQQTVSADDPAAAVTMTGIGDATYLIHIANDGLVAVSLTGTAAATASSSRRIPADGATYTYGPYSGEDGAVHLFAASTTSCVVELELVVSEG